MRTPILWLIPALAFAAVAVAAPRTERPGTRVLRKRIAVTPIEDRIATGNHRAFVSSIVGGITDMLTRALADSGQFMVVERAALPHLLNEQELGRLGVTTPQTAARPGQVLGAQLLITGALTEFELLSKDDLRGIRVGDFAVRLGRSRAHVGLDIRALDANTSVVLTTHRVRGSASSASTRFDVIGNRIDVFSDRFRRSAIGKAMREAVEDAVRQLVARLASEPWQGRLIVDREGQLYVNAGRNQNLRPGERFSILRDGEALIDPETGLPLTKRREQVGVVEIVAVHENYAAARAVSGREFRTGDLVQEIRSGAVSHAGN